MIAIIALVIQVLISLVTPADSPVTVIPAMPSYAPYVSDHTYNYEDGCDCEDCYWLECYYEEETEFTALFNSYSYKLSKNGRSMVNGKFVKMGV